LLLFISQQPTLLHAGSHSSVTTALILYTFAFQYSLFKIYFQTKELQKKTNYTNYKPNK